MRGAYGVEWGRAPTTAQRPPIFSAEACAAFWHREAALRRGAQEGRGRGAAEACADRRGGAAECRRPRTADVIRRFERFHAAPVVQRSPRRRLDMIWNNELVFTDL